MKSGLEGRNNPLGFDPKKLQVRWAVSMKTGLEGRNNPVAASSVGALVIRLNEVRPRRPKQCGCFVAVGG